MSTIAAPSTAPGRAGVAVIRVSGPAAAETISALAGIEKPRPRHAYFRPLRMPGKPSAPPLDHGLVVFFPGPRSATGEDVAEFQVHGGPAVVGAVLSALLEQPGVRPAEPGEFTRRAFENGRVDLVEAEGLADLIEAETEGQRRQALRQMEGALSAVYEGWRERLLKAMALIEAGIDFADEGDVPDDVARTVGADLGALLREARVHLDEGNRGERLREGVRVAIIGPPNVGKSSLLNCVAKRDVAIVSEEAGTTRDVVEVRLNLKGIPVTLADTAGLREAGAGAIEQEGIRRALRTAADADIVVAVAEPGGERITQADADILVQNKSDLLDAPQAARANGAFSLSALTGEGVGTFLRALEDLTAERFGVGDCPSLTRERHRRHVEAMTAELAEAVAGLEEKLDAALLAEHLRGAATHLGRLTGRLDVEAVLDEVFAGFCIGK